MILIMIIKTDNNKNDNKSSNNCDNYKKDNESSNNCHNQKKYNNYRCDTVGL